MLVVSTTMYAYDLYKNGIYYNKLSDGKSVEVTYRESGYIAYSGSVTIPSQVTHNGTTYSVTSIGAYAFDYCTGLTSVTIPNSVTNIGNYAFRGCTGLTTVTIPKSVTSIGESTFYKCTGLIKSAYPDNLNFSCPGIEIEYPSDGIIESDGTIYNAQKSILYFVPIDITSKDIPNSVITIQDYAFAHCSLINYVAIPNSVTSIGYWAFYNCSGLKTATIGNSVTYIPEKAFYNCTNLTSVSVGDHVSKIYDAAFWGCSNLTSLSNLNYVTYIGRDAFSGCSSLRSITIGRRTSSIGMCAFAGCSGLTSFTSNAITPPTCGPYAFDGIDMWECTLYVPAESISLYETADQWKEFMFFEKSGIEDIIVDDDNAGCPVEVYSIQGVKVGVSTDGLAPGIYFVKQGRSISKHIIY